MSSSVPLPPLLMPGSEQRALPRELFRDRVVPVITGTSVCAQATCKRADVVLMEDGVFFGIHCVHQCYLKNQDDREKKHIVLFFNVSEYQHR